MMDEDPYHCNCFVIDQQYSEILKNGLIQNGFFNPFQENHGQTFGFAQNLDSTLQFHLKKMPDGKIEAEIEPQTQFIEHLNQKFSSPAHFQVKKVLEILKIPYTQISNSVVCLAGKIKRPLQTTSVVKVIVVVAVGITVLVGLAAIFSKK